MGVPIVLSLESGSYRFLVQIPASVPANASSELLDEALRPQVRFADVVPAVGSIVQDVDGKLYRVLPPRPPSVFTPRKAHNGPINLDAIDGTDAALF